MADDSLHLLIELTAKARDVAARALAQSRAAEQQVINQLRALDQYQQEYRQNLQLELAKDGMSPSALTNYRGFLQSLEDAVERAQKSLERHRKQVAHHQIAWMAQWRKVSAIEALLSRRAEQAQVRAGRLEQRHTDELASQLRRRAATFPSSIDSSH
ncbi:flagellar export protein FliJ [Pseudomonas extremaustralis]|jgi:flagellar protein FliJ|uniref:Flagellar FliJ protein n=1 Tax=Pseudomonas extremaustralis TaxID=359110 RepID=A0A5C5Q576_9PSED|nr:flagellar export protein FliJ [Pseudomonas extremaustralis]EZI24807.1 flagellar assembly protein FliH [Pseudomonas extremaustralis 14-3 substr. 14-3b]MDB1109526.1 flagellar export protein FliJ [Pseudomonas extremaustralis]MDF3134064.1 flagellar export protein FliJ [Pseudomonas extremaustralis]MDG2969936.1 flagellar export protein FliJ [Pseudomonas extremaustralis]MDY7068549.1 Flagellar FliJ protein [Pseudomonas extremaustralis]